MEQAMALTKNIHTMFDGLDGEVILATLTAVLDHGIKTGICDMTSFVATMMLKSAVREEAK